MKIEDYKNMFNVSKKNALGIKIPEFWKTNLKKKLELRMLYFVIYLWENYEKIAYWSKAAVSLDGGKSS